MQRFKKILYVNTTETVDKPALCRAIALAATNEAQLTILHTVKQAGDMSPDDKLGQALRSSITSHLSEQVEQISKEVASQLPTSSIHFDVAFGEPFIDVVRCVLREGHDMVFKPVEKGSSLVRRTGFLTLDMHLLRKCPCPLWLYKDNKNDATHTHILAAIDPDKENPSEDSLTRMVLELATSLRAREGAETKLDIVHCWEAPYENTLRHSAFLKASTEDLQEHVESVRVRAEAAFAAALAPFDLSDKHITASIKKADAKIYIPDKINRETVDVLVMGTVARTGVAGLLIGNTAEAILADVDCSVLAVKPAGFITPIQA